MTGVEATVSIIEIQGSNYKVLNDSTPIAELLNSTSRQKIATRISKVWTISESTLRKRADS
jgi:hypothetical protein